MVGTVWSGDVDAGDVAAAATPVDVLSGRGVKCDLEFGVTILSGVAKIAVGHEVDMRARGSAGNRIDRIRYDGIGRVRICRLFEVSRS